MYYKSILLTIKEENNNRLTITNKLYQRIGFSTVGLAIF